ncbi:MAG: endopeptidase La [Bacteroidales bacterium]|jgi:ATP-dependent Lon protease|nr:endopeptidase La [Bacteroidales bacterium]
MKLYSETNYYETGDGSQSIVLPIITDIDDVVEDSNFSIDADATIPILPLKNAVLFPGVTIPVNITRKKSMRLVREAFQKTEYIGALTQKDANLDEPGLADMHPRGSIAQIVRILEMPDQTSTVILHGKKRFDVKKIVRNSPYMTAKFKLIDESYAPKEDLEFYTLVGAIRDSASNMLRMFGDIPLDIIFTIKNISDPHYLLNFIACNFPINVEEKITMLNIDNPKERGQMLLRTLSHETQLVEIRTTIQNKARKDINQQQREYFLQQQLKTIQNELGGTAQEQDVEEMRKKAKKKKWNKNVAAIFEKELKKLEQLNAQSPDYSVQMQYMQTIISLPWNEYTQDNLNLKNVQTELDNDHYGLEKVKERIIEHLAVLKLKGDLKSPILCLYGPPGVGKTSLGKSVANALKRKYVRISLGGLHDEAEIRGHRKTYIGAMPGRIIQSLKKAGSSNPVFILDEIDKVGNDFKGDPASALLEVLDPEQNSAFHDNYLDIDFDLSHVMFIATANTLNNISQPLLDRMELIEVSGYLLEEKIEIACSYLIPKELENHGIPPATIEIPRETIQRIIESYTRESGVRELDKKIAKIMRRLALKIGSEEKILPVLLPENLNTYLGIPEYTNDKYEGNSYAGVVTGLAWTAVGGEILYVESSLSNGKDTKLTLTGNLGDVMKESAILALEYIKAHAEKLGIKNELLENRNVHIHVPEGAIPKDGPSAGITMATSLVSTFLQRKVKKHLAMTGEITLRGKVLPVGGIKEKILAAKRAGIKEIILSEENRKDIGEIKDIYIKGLKFHYVNDIREVLDIALLKEKATK